MRESLADVTINDNDSGALPVQIVGASGQTVPLAVAQVLTATTNSSAHDTSAYTELFLLYNVTGASGTAPTFQAQLQTSPDNGATWYVVATMPQQAGNGNATRGFGIAQGTAFGSLCRVLFIIGGTNPSMTVDCYIVLKP